MKLKNATTLQDIAREAGVSAMTVSVVLNGANSSTRVSHTTRTRVEKVAESLHYRPNGVARGLSRRRMDARGVAAETDGNSVNLHFLEILNGILAACAVHGQNTTIFPVTNWQHDEKKLLQFCDGRIDGMLCISPMFSRIPEQISVVGFDDSLLALMTVPPLTTVRQPLRRMGGRAVEVLLQQIRLSLAPSPLITIPPPNIVNEVFDYEVLLRGSACPPLL